MGLDIAGIGYLAVPDSGLGAGVIVIQEWWGLVPHIKSIADRFAAAGYVALAPDLYDGEQTTNPDEAGRMLMTLNIQQTAQKLEAAAGYLLEHKAVTSSKLGVIGFCMGGQLALLAATVSDRFAAVVDFYGIHPNVNPDFTKLNVPVLGIFGEKDNFVSQEAVKNLEARIQESGGAIETHTYADADHAFFNDTRPEVYNPTAATDAWNRTLTFFNQHLQPA
jgi:carboxymethylenebutenolidase